MERSLTSLFNSSLTLVIKCGLLKRGEHLRKVLSRLNGRDITITKRVFCMRRPPVYKIADYEGNELEGTFYEQKLQKVSKRDMNIIE